MNPEQDDFMGGGGKSVPFDNVGDSVGGLIVAPPERRQQTDIDSGAPKVFADGSPMTMFAIRIQTELRDPEDPTDTGERVLYLKWKSLDAVRSAIRASGAKGLEVGGFLILTLTGFGPRKKAAHNPPKLWAAQYVPPDPNTAFMAETPTQQPVPAAAVPTVNPADAREAMRRLSEQQARNQQRLMATPVPQLAQPAQTQGPIPF